MRISEFHLDAGSHRLRVFVVRDDTRAVEQAWAYEVARARKAGADPLPKPEIRTRLLAGTLSDHAGAVVPPYPEYLEVRGPYGLVLPAMPPGYRLIFTCGHAPGQHTPACVRTNLENLARRAWRRPVSPGRNRQACCNLASGCATDSGAENGNRYRGDPGIAVVPLSHREKSPLGRFPKRGLAPLLFSVEQLAR